MSAITEKPSWPKERGIQNAKEIAELNMLTQAAQAALDKLWADTFKTNAGIDAGNSADYTYRGSSNFDVIKTTTSPDVLTGGTPSASSVNGGNAAANAVDGTETDGNYWRSNVANSGWWKYDLGASNEKTVVKYRIISYNSSNAGVRPKTWTLEGSNNDSDWDVLDTISAGGLTDGAWKEFTFSNSTAYRYYRINITATEDAAQEPAITEIEMMEDPPGSAVIQSIRALDLAAAITEAMVFIDVTLNAGTLDSVEISTDDGSTWTDVTSDLETLKTVPSGQQIKLRVTLSGDAELESWGVAV